MRIGLVHPIKVAPDENPGCLLIAAGARYLLRRAQEAEFVSIELHGPWGDAERRAASGCDLLVLCGNPRYDIGTHEWMYSGLLDAMLSIGRPVVDLWAGACAPLRQTFDAGVERLWSNPRNQLILARLLDCFVVTRDPMAQALNERAGIRSTLLPCSSWWAAKEFGIARAGGTKRVLIPIHCASPDRVRFLARGRQVVAITEQDREWCHGIGMRADLIYEPERLLRLFAQCEEVVSFRLHSAIPAASLGCRVLMEPIDTRAEACDLFGIPREGSPDFGTEPADPVPELRRILHAALG